MRSAPGVPPLLNWLSMAASFVLLNACAGSKDIAEPLPAWVENRPQIQGYYIGVANASKIQFPFDAAERAQRSALAELAGQIRVSIDAKSVLHSSQFQGIAGQSFSETITSSSVEELEGYERMGYYENKTDIWTYYRLSQSTYERIRSERKTAALQLAGDYWMAAQEAIQKNDVQQGLDRFIRSLESLENYWGEINRWKAPEGETIALDRACIDGISHLISGLRLAGQSNEIILSFQQRYAGTASCEVKFEETPIAGMPVEWSYNRGTLPKKANRTTGENGISEILLEGFESGVSRSELEARIPLNQLMPNLKGSKVSALIGTLSDPQQVWPIKLVTPTLYIETEESISGESSKQKKLRDALAQGLNDAGLNWVNTLEEADLKLTLRADTRQAGSGSGFFTVYLDASILLETIDGMPILQRNMQNVKGVQLNWNAAHEKAYSNAQSEIQGPFIQELLNSLYQ